MATRFVAAADVWAEGKEAWLGAAVVAILAASFVAGQRRAPARVGRIARRSRRRAVASRRQPSARRTPAAGGSDRR